MWLTPDEDGVAHGHDTRIRRAGSIVVLLVGTLIASGCRESEPPNPQALSQCLQKAQVDVSTNREDMDLVAEGAGVGAVVADWKKNRANIVIERSESDAERTEARYRPFFEAFGGNPDETVKRKGATVVAYDKVPTETETETVSDCLS